MSIADKLSTIAENQQKVYEAGIKNEDIKMWEMITANGRMLTANGSRKTYSSAFRQTNFCTPDGKVYSFPFPVQPTNSVNHMFYDYLGTELPGNIDFSGITPSTNAQALFAYSGDLKKVPDMKLPAMDKYDMTYGFCYALEEIEMLRVHENTVFADNTFHSCENLKNIVIDGYIGTNLNLQWCKQLSIASLKGIITALIEYKGTSNEGKYSLTLHADSKAALEEEGATALDGLTWIEYAESKGWDIA